jgi:hypothetical protein
VLVPDAWSHMWHRPWRAAAPSGPDRAARRRPCRTWAPLRSGSGGAERAVLGMGGTLSTSGELLFGWRGNVPIGDRPGVKPPGRTPGQPAAIDTSQAPKAPPPSAALPAREQRPALHASRSTRAGGRGAGSRRRSREGCRAATTILLALATPVPGRPGTGGLPVPFNRLARWQSRAGPAGLATARPSPAAALRARGWRRSVGASAGTARRTLGRNGHRARCGCWPVGGRAGWRRTTPSKSV